MINLEEVFKLSGTPTYTFVKPIEYTKLLISLRTAGRGLVIEGPSGIGKTTSINMALGELGYKDSALRLTARKKEDRDIIASLPEMGNIGVVIVDDFHKLSDDIKLSLADYMKTLADEENPESKLVVIGINKAGDSLVHFAPDLNNRIDTIKFEVNPQSKILELIEKGERILNIEINTKSDIIENAKGSFHITQMLCNWTCLLAEVVQTSVDKVIIEISFELVRERVLEELARLFAGVAKKFATGPRLRREGRAPYLHILNWLAVSNEWSIQLDYELAKYPEHKGSVGQVIDKGYLEKFLNDNPDFNDVIHYNPSTLVLNVEDPKFVYYIRNLLWSKFALQIGYKDITFKSNYDFAFSFAGENRSVVEDLFENLSERELSVFYDKNEQHRIVAVDVEEYLGPIYRTEALFIVVFLSKEYPKKIWTKFESVNFKDRFGTNSVIPIWFSDSPPGMFDESTRVGGLAFNPDDEVSDQVEKIAEVLAKKILEFRNYLF
ncbi:ATPase [Paenibacillus albidus]|uniref:ATPase n=1 Tax=Paenibacillus albidus TaxID=2041023 RepID=UPI0020363FA6|nr:ATPase [Paenibacillus albidus]